MSTRPEPPPRSGPTSPPPRPASRGRLLLAVPALGILFLIAVIWLSSSRAPVQSIVLISPAEAARPVPPRPFAQFRYKIRQFIYPVWRHFQRPVRLAIVSTTILAMPPLPNGQTGLGTPSVTNADGVCAWIISTAALDAASARLKAMPVCKPLFSPSDLMANGVPMYRGFGFASNANIYLNVMPRMKAGSLSLVISAFEVTHDPASHLATTNFAAAFKATLPSHGGVIVCDQNRTNADGQLYWLLLSAATLDAHGKPTAP
jgi:hypothetical protein